MVDIGWKDLAGLFGILGAALLSLYWNFRSAAQARRIPYLQKQFDSLTAASKSAATLSSTTDLGKWIAAQEEFWILYYGELAIVEDVHVEQAMVEFGKQLSVLGSSPTLPTNTLQASSLTLATAARQLILASWKINMPPQADARKTALWVNKKREV